MKSNIKSFTALFLIIFLALNLNCGDNKKEDGSEVTIKFWHSFVISTIPALNELITKFENENPGIKIDAQYIPTGDALIQKLITSVQSNTAPDISWLRSDYMEDLAEADAIYKMEDFINGENGVHQEDLDDIYPALIQLASWKGTLYSMPMEATNLALLYNKDMFKKAGLDPEKPPKDWNELYEYSKKLTFDSNNDGNLDQIGFFVPVYPAAGPQYGWMIWNFLPFLWQAGGYVVTEDQSKVIYNSEAGVEALNLWKNLYNDMKLNVFTTDYDIAFASKRLAMAIDGPWNLPRFEELLKNVDWAFAPLPAGPEKQATIIGGEYLGIFKQSKNPDAAWKFLKWMIQPEVQAFWAMKSGYLPIRNAAIQVPEFQEYLEENPNFKAFVDQLEYAQAQRPIDYGALEVSRHIAEAIEKATLGKMNSKKALDQSAAKSNKVLSEKR